MPLPSVGGGHFLNKGGKVDKLFLHGHSNRPFYHIVITDRRAKLKSHPVEQLGTYDPMPNKDNQKLVSLNVERTRYWMGEGATFSRAASKLLGMAGFLPIDPRTYVEAWRYRHKEATDAEKAAVEAVAADSSGTSQPPSSSSS